MKKVYGVICGKYRKFKNPKISFIFGKLSFFFFIIFSNYNNEAEKIFKEEESIAISRIIGLIKNI